jgi:hypothetical protein
LGAEGGRRGGAGLAQPFRLDRGAADGEAGARGGGGKGGGKGRVLDLPHPPAGAADQELRGMVVPGILQAADEGGQPLDLVDEALGEQEIERAIDGRRRLARSRSSSS